MASSAPPGKQKSRVEVTFFQAEGLSPAGAEIRNPNVAPALAGTSIRNKLQFPKSQNPKRGGGDRDRSRQQRITRITRIFASFA
jgi:hypothetical protein